MSPVLEIPEVSARPLLVLGLQHLLIANDAPLATQATLYPVQCTSRALACMYSLYHRHLPEQWCLIMVGSIASLGRHPGHGWSPTQHKTTSKLLPKNLLGANVGYTSSDRVSWCLPRCVLLHCTNSLQEFTACIQSQISWGHSPTNDLSDAALHAAEACQVRHRTPGCA